MPVEEEIMQVITFVRCDECRGIFHPMDIITVDRAHYCELCHEHLFVRCSKCGKICRTEGAYYQYESGAYFCYDCFEKSTRPPEEEDW